MGEGLRDYFLAALLVGMDPTATDDLLMEIHKTCDAVGCAIDAAQGDSFDVVSLLQFIRLNDNDTHLPCRRLPCVP